MQIWPEFFALLYDYSYRVDVVSTWWTSLFGVNCWNQAIFETAGRTHTCIPRLLSHSASNLFLGILMIMLSVHLLGKLSLYYASWMRGCSKPAAWFWMALKNSAGIPSIPAALLLGSALIASMISAMLGTSVLIRVVVLIWGWYPVYGATSSGRWWLST